MNKQKKIGLAVLVVILLYAAISVFFQYHYFIGTKVNGYSCGFRSVSKTKELIKEDIKAYKITIKERNKKKESISFSQVNLAFKDDGKLEGIKAQQKGYAEADPTADIEGLDAGRKVAILSSVAFNSRVVFDDVYTEGITKITSKDIKYAKEMGCDIKLLGMAKNTEDGIEAYVCPMLIPSNHPLASVNDSYNAVFVNGDAVENAMFYGRGAGELPTASAVVGDLFDIARNISAGCCGRIGCTCYKEIPVKKMADTHNRYFMRLIVEDRCGVLAEMTAVFAKYGVSVAQIIQKAAREAGSAEVVVITAKVREGDFRTAMEELSGRESVRKISSMLRVYGE